jgi:cytochrome P450
MLHFVSTHADVQQRLRAEVGAALGGAALWEQLADGERLRYVDALMSETFRFRPVAPAIFLCANTDVALGGYALPAGTDVLAVVRTAAQSDAEFPDAQRFNPDRWIGPDAANFATHPPLPFGSGPRMCPGRNLAQLEIKSVVSMVARSFEVEAVAGKDPVRERFSFTLVPDNLRLRFRAIQ